MSDQSGTDTLHGAIVALRGHVRDIQAAKRVVADGGSPGHNPMLTCINALPEIVRTLEAAELEIEADFERYEDAAAPVSSGVSGGGEEPVAWASEWTGISGLLSRGFHHTEAEAKANADWMEGRAYPLYARQQALISAGEGVG